MHSRIAGIVKTSSLEMIIIAGLCLLFFAGLKLSDSLSSWFGPNPNEFIVNTGLDKHVQSFSDLMSDFDAVALLTNVLFWSALGAGVYIILFLIIAILSSTSELFAVTFHYVHARSFNPFRYWLSFVGEKLMRVSALILAVFYGVVLLTIVLPWVSDRFSSVSVNESFNVVVFMSTFGLFVFANHIMVVFVRLVFLRLHPIDE